MRLLRRKLRLRSCNAGISILRVGHLLPTLSCRGLAVLLGGIVCVGGSRRILGDDWWWRAAGSLSPWWKSQTLSISHIIRVRSRCWLIRWRERLFVAHIRRAIATRVDAQRVRLLVYSLVVILRRRLPHSNKLSLILRAIHDLPSGREHSTLNLTALGHLSSSTPVWMHLTVRLLNFTVLLTLINASHALAPSTEEALHAVQIHHSLCTLLLFLLDCVHLVVLWVLLLHTTRVVTKSALLLLLSTRALDLRLERVVYALSLWQRMVHALWTAYAVHRHIGAHRHALVDLAVASWRKWVSTLLTLATSSAWDIAMAMGSAMRSLCRLVPRLHHRWQLELLIVEVVGFFTSVSLSVARNFLFEIDPRWAVSLIMSNWTPFRRHADIQRIMFSLSLLPGGNHMRTHVQADVLIATVGVGWLACMIVTLVHETHWVIDCRMLFARWMNSAAVQALV